MNLKEKDRCVVCGEETRYFKDTPISLRFGYIEGAGQLCPSCWKDLGGAYPGLSEVIPGKKNKFRGIRKNVRRRRIRMRQKFNDL
ncbi:MAG: hypothetical protein WC320_01200 [Candidatus Paceibacterota bacterium]|jgi:hypothetical protein